MRRMNGWIQGGLTLILVLAMGVPAFAAKARMDVDPDPEALQKDTLFAGTDAFAKGAKDATEVNLDKNMLAMMGRFMGSGDSDKDAVNLAKKMEFVYVRSYEYEKPGQYKASDLDAFRQRLEGADWSHIVKERSKDEQNDIWVRTDSEGQFSELVVISAEATELNFVHLKGHMTMQELTQAGAKYGVPQNIDPKLQKRDR